MADATPRQLLFEAVLSDYQAEHDELSQNARSLETKAQGNVAIAGIFLGGLFAFVRDAGDSFGSTERALFVFAAFSLGCSVLAAALSLLARLRTRVLLGDSVAELATDLNGLESDAEIATRIPGFVFDRAQVWRRRVDMLKLRVARTGDALWLAQVLLFIGIVTTMVATIVRLF